MAEVEFRSFSFHSSLDLGSSFSGHLLVEFPSSPARFVKQNLLCYSQSLKRLPLPNAFSAKMSCLNSLPAEVLANITTRFSGYGAISLLKTGDKKLIARLEAGGVRRLKVAVGVTPPDDLDLRIFRGLHFLTLTAASKPPARLNFPRMLRELKLGFYGSLDLILNLLNANPDDNPFPHLIAFHSESGENEASLKPLQRLPLTSLSLGSFVRPLNLLRVQDLPPRLQKLKLYHYRIDWRINRPEETNPSAYPRLRWELPPEVPGEPLASLPSGLVDLTLCQGSRNDCTRTNIDRVPKTLTRLKIYGSLTTELITALPTSLTELVSHASADPILPEQFSLLPRSLTHTTFRFAEVKSSNVHFLPPLLRSLLNVRSSISDVVGMLPRTLTTLSVVCPFIGQLPPSLKLLTVTDLEPQYALSLPSSISNLTLNGSKNLYPSCILEIASSLPHLKDLTIFPKLLTSFDFFAHLPRGITSLKIDKGHSAFEMPNMPLTEALVEALPRTLITLTLSSFVLVNPHAFQKLPNYLRCLILYADTLPIGALDAAAPNLHILTVVLSYPPEGFGTHLFKALPRKLARLTYRLTPPSKDEITDEAIANLPETLGTILLPPTDRLSDEAFLKATHLPESVFYGDRSTLVADWQSIRAAAISQASQ